MKKQHDDHESEKFQFPVEIVPEELDDMCKHGNSWKTGDLVAKG